MYQLEKLFMYSYKYSFVRAASFRPTLPSPDALLGVIDKHVSRPVPQSVLLYMYLDRRTSAPSVLRSLSNEATLDFCHESQNWRRAMRMTLFGLVDSTVGRDFLYLLSHTPTRIPLRNKLSVRQVSFLIRTPTYSRNEMSAALAYRGEFSLRGKRPY